MPAPCEHHDLTMVITELDIGGAEKAFVQVAVGLQQLGWRVTVVSLRDEGPLSAELRLHDIPVTALGARGPADPLCVWRLARLLRKHSPDAVLTFLHQANLMGRLAALLAGIRCVVCGIRVADRRMAVWLPERLSRWCVSHYICNSAKAAQVHSELCRIPCTQISVILNGVDVEKISQTEAVSRSSLQLENTDCVLLCAGRLTPQKAPLDLLRAFLKLPDDLQQRCRLLYAGDGPLAAELKSEIVRAGQQARIRLLGWRPDVIGLMKTADAVVLPSHWEGMPNVLMEALAAARPVIAADVDGVSELLGQNPLCRLYAPGDIDALSQSLAQFIRSQSCDSHAPPTTEANGVEELTWDRCIQNYDRVLRQILARTPKT